MENLKKAVIYARQSSGSDDFSDSVENQIENCKKLAKKEGIEIIGTFQDLNTSGKTYPVGAENIAETDRAFQVWFNQQTGTKKFRQGLGFVMEHLAEVDYIIVDDMTRLYRPVTRSFLESYINQALTDHSVKVLQVKGGKIDLSQFDQALIQSLKNAIQDEAIANQKAKSKQQLKKRRDSGLFANGGGKGYGTVYNVVTKAIRIQDQESAVIRFIFDEIEKYTPYLQILKALNEKYSHLCKGKAYYESNLYHIARNPIYCGYMVDSQGLLIKNMQIENPCISYDQFKRVQEIMDNKKKNPPKAKFRWLPFSGLLYCGNCGAKLVSGTDKTGTYYYCNRGQNLKLDDDCRGARVVFDTVKDLYVGLKQAISPLLIMAYIEEMESQKLSEMDTENLESLKVELSNMETRQKQLTGLFLKGLMTESELETALQEHKAETANIRSRIDIAEKALQEKSIIQKHMESTWAKIKAYRAVEAMDNSEYESLLKRVVKRIDVFADRITIKTIYGEFTLARYIVKNRRNFPVSEMQINGRNLDSLSITITYRTGKQEGLIADFNRIKVYSA